MRHWTDLVEGMSRDKITEDVKGKIIALLKREAQRHGAPIRDSEIDVKHVNTLASDLSTHVHFSRM